GGGGGRGPGGPRKHPGPPPPKEEPPAFPARVPSWGVPLRYQNRRPGPEDVDNQFPAGEPGVEPDLDQSDRRQGSWIPAHASGLPAFARLGEWRTGYIRLMPDSGKRPSTFPPRVLSLLMDSRMLGIRAGSEHRFTGVWFVLVAGRLFVRPWNDKPTGWHRALLRERRGAITVLKREIPIRARPSRGEGLFDAV